MKYLTLTVFIIFSMYVANAQAKGDTTKSCTRCWPKIKESAFEDIVFLMQQNLELSKRLDKLENKIDSLEARPYLFIDLNKQQPGVWLTNKEGEYMWYIAPINIK